MKNPRTGLSLIEIVVAMVLLAIAAVSAFEFLAYCSRLTLQSETRIAAANFARETMESLYKKTYDNLAVTASPVSDNLPGGSILEKRYSFTPTRKYTVTEDLTNGYKLITVTVTWNQ